jgi:ABC-type nitrate/sulfonate/bicarbonate transport system substrate-binding protein
MPPARAAIKTGQIDGYIGALETGYALEEQKEWRVITSADSVRRAFHHARVLRARGVIQKRPEVVRAFLRGWMDTIAFMKANKDKTVEITAKVINVKPVGGPAAPTTSRFGIFSTDGTFGPRQGRAQGVVS